ncbi:hypothetical protein MU0083_003395 [[Mycobacterium] kokjensenii]|uniref:Uncharacterized protein n=1 Tax=[Mycobacterium] kokjensenii TaxID=3064287 RepID=A0ABM9LT41_9MYCO|nr:hypothetical protein [Mycolicibacter sp. MU0083]CAJ1504274.1 hypothetical protein MU0083_003395 [Mycolicibacter sp. MU0083]
MIDDTTTEKPDRIIVRCAYVGEDFRINTAGLSLLSGIPEDQILPGPEHDAEYWRAAARRINEAEANGSGSGLGAVLAYYADIERDGAELVLIEENH